MDDPDQWLDALEFVDGLRYTGSCFALSDPVPEEPQDPYFEMLEGVQEALEGFQCNDFLFRPWFWSWPSLSQYLFRLMNFIILGLIS